MIFKVTPCAAQQLESRLRLLSIECGDCIHFREPKGVREHIRGEESACPCAVASALIKDS